MVSVAMSRTTLVWRKTFSLTVSDRCNPLLISALCYHGRLRVATGLSLLDGMSDLLKNAEQIDIRE
jgi:hypothetical protein